VNIEKHVFYPMNLFTFLNNYFGKSLQGLPELSINTHYKKFKKGAVITEYNKIEKKLYFIISGITQLTILHNGEEKIVDFFFENSFVCAYTSLLMQTPSDVRLTAITDCETEIIEYNDLQQAYKTSMVANQIGRLLTEQIYMMKTKREKDFLIKSAQERYSELVSKRPDILQLIPVNKIASYLGIHPESLSRIRRLLIS
jgi:CRP-like cAMP-binding protein